MRISAYARPKMNTSTKRGVSLDCLGYPPSPASPVTKEFWKKPEGYQAVEAAVITANKKKYNKK